MNIPTDEHPDLGTHFQKFYSLFLFFYRMFFGKVKIGRFELFVV